MKLAFFDNYKLGVVVGDKIVDVSAATKGIKALGPQDVIRGVIEKWSTYKGKLAAAAKKGKGKPLVEGQAAPAAAEAGKHHLHGGQLHGRRHAAGAGADQRLHEIAELRSSATATPWCCPTWRRRFSRARPKSPS